MYFFCVYSGSMCMYPEGAVVVCTDCSPDICGFMFYINNGNARYFTPTAYMAMGYPGVTVQLPTPSSAYSDCVASGNAAYQNARYGVARSVLSPIMGCPIGPNMPESESCVVCMLLGLLGLKTHIAI